MSELTYEQADAILMGQADAKDQILVITPDGKFLEGKDAMGDRFYMQQQAPKKRSTRVAAEPKEKKVSKADLVTAMKQVFPGADLSALLQADLQTLADWAAAGQNRLVSHKQPSGRLKAPWVEALTLLVEPAIDWNRLTVANMKAVYEALLPVE